VDGYPAAAGYPSTNPAGYPPTYPAAAVPAYGSGPQYASWIVRVAGYLIDYVVVAIPSIIGVVVVIAGVHTTQSTDPTTGAVTTTLHGGSGGGAALFLLLDLVTVVLWFWNRCIRAGRTGQSLGKSAMGTRLLALSDGQPIGTGKAFLRDLAHILDSLACYLGWLWPLWDARRQTFADKVMATCVIRP